MSQTLTGFFEEGRLACLEVHAWQKMCLWAKSDDKTTVQLILQYTQLTHNVGSGAVGKFVHAW